MITRIPHAGGKDEETIDLRFARAITQLDVWNWSASNTVRSQFTQSSLFPHPSPLVVIYALVPFHTLNDSDTLMAFAGIKQQEILGRIWNANFDEIFEPERRLTIPSAAWFECGMCETGRYGACVIPHFFKSPIFKIDWEKILWPRIELGYLWKRLPNTAFSLGYRPNAGNMSPTFKGSHRGHSWPLSWSSSFVLFDVWNLFITRDRRPFSHFSASVFSGFYILPYCRLSSSWQIMMEWKSWGFTLFKWRIQWHLVQFLRPVLCYNLMTYNDYRIRIFVVIRWLHLDMYTKVWLESYATVVLHEYYIFVRDIWVPKVWLECFIYEIIFLVWVIDCYVLFRSKVGCAIAALWRRANDQNVHRELLKNILRRLQWLDDEFIAVCSSLVVVVCMTIFVRFSMCFKPRSHSFFLDLKCKILHACSRVAI